MSGGGGGGNPPPTVDAHAEASEDWLMSYADFVTVLMGFFVLLFALSDPDPGKFEEVSKGITENLTSKQVQTPFRDLRTELNSVATEAGSQVGMVQSNERGQVIPFLSDRMFAPGSADILPASEPTLDRIAQLLTLSFASSNYKVEIEGHTDDVPIATQRFPSNWELSSARASAVVRFLISRGVAADRLSAIGYADTKPLVPNRDATGKLIPENQARNRRVMIRIER